MQLLFSPARDIDRMRLAWRVTGVYGLAGHFVYGLAESLVCMAWRVDFGSDCFHRPLFQSMALHIPREANLHQVIERCPNAWPRPSDLAAGLAPPV